jgi:hypothetical protein
MTSHSKDQNSFNNHIDDELLQTQPLQNNLLSEFEREEEDEKMNFSFTADGAGGFGVANPDNEASMPTT